MLRWLVGVALIATVALCAACSGGGTPRALPKLPPSRDRTASVLGNVPHDLAGAKAYVDRLFATLDAAIATGNVSRLKTMLLPTCSCFRIVPYLESVYRNDHLSGRGYSLLRFNRVVVGRADATVLLSFRVSRIDEFGKSGKIVKVQAAVPRTQEVVILVPRVHGWVVSNIEALPR
jgi:hypothetical protein